MEPMGAEHDASYLVDHHDRKKVQESRKEEAVHVVLHVGADGLGKCVKQDLADDKSCHAESDVPQRPAFQQSADDQHDLHDDVDEKEDRREEVDNDEESNRVVRAKTTPTLESEQGDDKADDEH